jgi:hypothetical protein
VCSGDSFFAGSGLADHLVTGYPGLVGESLSRFPNPQADKWREKVTTLRHKDNGLHRQMLAEEWKLNWPGQLGLLLNDPSVIIINDSLGGSSTMRAERVIKNWILVLRERYPSLPISIVMGLSDISRFEVYDSLVNHWKIVLPGMHFGKNPAIGQDDREFYSSLGEFYVNRSMCQEIDLLRSANSILNVWAVCTSLNVKFSTMTWLHQGQIIQINELCHTSKYRYVFDSLIKKDLFFTYNIRDTTNDYRETLHCFDGHYSHYIHSDFAKRILNDGKV